MLAWGHISPKFLLPTQLTPLLLIPKASQRRVSLAVLTDEAAHGERRVSALCVCVCVCV